MTSEHDILRVGGIQPLTLIDFPGHLATVLFLQGCNLRCRFCYNCTLLPSIARETINWSSIIDFLKDRQGFIEGVVFSGGEPCLQSGIIDAMSQVRELGFDIALHTNGFYPETLEKILEQRLVKFVAVDFKAPFNRYKELTGHSVDEAGFTKVVDMIVSSGVQHEFRTTVHPQFLRDSDILAMAGWLVERKISRYALQKFKHGNSVDQTLPPVVGPWLQSATLLKLKTLFSSFEVRSDNSAEVQQQAA